MRIPLAERCKWMIVRTPTGYEECVKGIKYANTPFRCRRRAGPDGQCWQHRLIAETQEKLKKSS